MISGVLRIRILAATYGVKAHLSSSADLIINGLILDNLNDLVTQVDIVASIKTDHSSIILELEDIKESRKGPGFWKLHTSLLNRSNWLDDAKDLTDNRAKWDWLKFKIKTSSITHSKKIAQERKKREEEQLQVSRCIKYIPRKPQ